MYILWLITLEIVGMIYSPWITRQTLSSGDWPYLYAENIREFSYIPEIRFLWLSPYYQSLTKFLFEFVHMSWPMIEKMFWFFPFVVVSAWSSYRWTKSWIGVLVYTTNTYILMVVGGGQLGVAMAYAIAPLVFKKFTVYTRLPAGQGSQFRDVAISSLLLAIQVMFDPRIALLTVVAAVVYWIVVGRGLKRLISWLVVPVGITTVIHTYWWVPLLKNPGILRTQIQEVSSEAVKYLSFASYSQTLSLTHPNWPENIFGKVYFMRPEFLLIPIIAFGVFLWGKKQEIQAALPYGVLALLGAFLAKGAQEPFGGVYLWMFDHIPGFWLFRDSTKFYLLIALAYTYLIPASIESVTSRWKTGITTSTKILGVLFLLMWAVMIRQAVTHQLSGTFQSHSIDPEYVQLKNLITALPDGAATYWIPSRQRFGFSSKSHPALSASDEIPGGNLNTILPSLQSPDTQIRLKHERIVYVIVPYDTAGEIFLTDRAYDWAKYDQTVSAVGRIPWLTPVTSLAKVRVWSLKSRLK